MELDRIAQLEAALAQAAEEKRRVMKALIREKEEHAHQLAVAIAQGSLLALVPISPVSHNSGLVNVLTPLIPILTYPRSTWYVFGFRSLPF